MLLVVARAAVVAGGAVVAGAAVVAGIAVVAACCCQVVDDIAIAVVRCFVVLTRP